MKKLLAVFLVGGMINLGLVSSGHADEIGDLIKTTLIDHVTTVTQFKSGETKVALKDSVVLIGSYDGRSILDLQVGISAETAPSADEVTGGNLIFGGFLKLSSLVKNKIKLADHWKFLNSIEYGVAWDYDTREKADYASFQVGLAFGLAPIQ